MTMESVKYENMHYVICSAGRVQVDVRGHSIVNSIEREIISLGILPSGKLGSSAWNGLNRVQNWKSLIKKSRYGSCRSHPNFFFRPPFAGVKTFRVLLNVPVNVRGGRRIQDGKNSGNVNVLLRSGVGAEHRIGHVSDLIRVHVDVSLSSFFLFSLPCPRTVSSLRPYC